MNGGNSNLLFIHAQTSLHPGSGTASGAIDLPVQRERHTDWPLIPGSTIKGVLRDYCRSKILEGNTDKGFVWADRDPKLECVFGPSIKGADGTDNEPVRGSNPEDFAGALAVTDARVLFFPVRSLCGLFAWVTCPAALERFRRDIEVMRGNEALGLGETSLKNDREAKVVSDKLLVKNSAAVAGGSHMVLEEFDFTAIDNDSTLKKFAEKMSGTLGIERLKTHLAMIPDDMFTHFVKNATEVNARIALNYETKTAGSGALFYVETLPPETVFYSLLIANRPKGKRTEIGRSEESDLKNEEDVLKYLSNLLEPTNGTSAILQIGGEASTGKGICCVILHDGSNL